jgi:hypothetical protein
MRESDLVVIAQPVATKESGQTTSDNPWKAEFVGIHTTFTVEYTFKGKHDSNKLIVVHYRLKKGDRIQHGPAFVTFRLVPMVLEDRSGGYTGWKQSEYLLFLKKRKDGYYEPVSGQLDAQLSVREVAPPLPAEPRDLRSK